MAKAGTERDFQAILGRDKDAARFSGISAQFMGCSVQALSGMRPGYGRDVVCGYGVLVESETHPGRDKDIARFSDSSRQFLGHSVPSRGCCRDASRLSGIFMQFLEHGVQALSGTRTRIQPGFQAVFRTRCAGHVQDAAGTHSDFYVFLGRVQATAGTQPDFQAFLGGRDVALFSGISRQFVGTVCRPSLGRILAAIETQPNFQAILGNFWDSVYKPSLRRFMATVGTQPDFEAILGRFWVHSSGGGNDEEKAFLGSLWSQCTSHVRDACLGRFPATLGTRVDFQPNEGSTMCRQCQGRTYVPKHSRQFLGMVCRIYSRQVMATTGTQPNFLAFFDSFWALCVGHVRDASGRSRDAA
ncbi:Hypothetical predicted protein [Olea europaea subsp. europaea]|uniref:Uncharacterized protein n=1 Tax=Olea europaea subsp. europaea TaxID=158383 RepID=A0A8S0PDV9_OLEEU|nr:Hypothetical predicted protein [Olea europaea subsp. europaea]